MTVEKGEITLDDLKRINVEGIPFGYTRRKNEEGNNEIVVLPFPDKSQEFNICTNYFSYETLILLHSKYKYGIKHRTQMFGVLYNTFVEEFKNKQKSVDEFLTLQTLYGDMIMRLGIILEDFAGMCYACKQYQQHGSDIARVFLAYSDPISFYSSIIERKGKRKIKQIFNLPQSKGKLQEIFKDVSEEEINLLMKAVESCTTIIHEKFRDISEAIVRFEKGSVTYYDIYNKLKHGFSPYYPFIVPLAVPVSVDKTIEGNLSENKIKELISINFFENLTIMHDKLSGQRTVEEQELFKNEGLATPTFIAEEINLKTAEQMMNVVSDIDFIYRHLMKKYMLISEGNPHMSLLMSDDYLSSEERVIVESIIDDKNKYNG